MIAEADEKHPVSGAQYFSQEDLQVMLMLLVEVVLATAGVDHQAQREWNVHAAGEKRNLLWNGVFEDLNIVFGEVIDQRSVGVPDRECDIDEFYINPDRLLCGTE